MLDEAKSNLSTKLKRLFYDYYNSLIQQDRYVYDVQSRSIDLWNYRLVVDLDNLNLGIDHEINSQDHVQDLLAYVATVATVAIVICKCFCLYEITNVEDERRCRNENFQSEPVTGLVNWL